MTTEKTVLTPSEFAQVQSGLRFSIGELHGRQSVIAAAVLDQMVITQKGRIGSLTVKAGVTGTAGLTTVVVNKNGAPVGPSVSIDNTEVDGTTKKIGIDEDVDLGDVVDVEVTVAPTAGANLDFFLDVDKLFTVGL